jgi:RimJ/RimL family protein N-acetyltransferase
MFSRHERSSAILIYRSYVQLDISCIRVSTEVMAAKLEQPIGAPISDHHAQPPSRTITLSGRLASIVPASAKYADELYPLVSGEENKSLWTYMTQYQKASPEVFNAYMEKVAHPDDDRVNYIILRKNLDNTKAAKPVGMIGFMGTDPVNRLIEISNVFFTSALQRTPAATEVHYLLIRYAFEDLDMRRVEWKCDSLNVPSQAAAKRLGFQFEGLFRHHRIYKGRTRDTMWFSMLREEWEGGYKTSFEEWLHESNFDANGQQLRRLEECRSDVVARMSHDDA